MTLIWIADHKRATVPPVGYLSASSRRSDSDCLNRPHLAEVLRARRDRENFAHQNGEPVQGVHPDAGDAAPGLPAASIIERLDEWWLSLSHREARFLVSVIALAVFCAACIVIL